MRILALDSSGLVASVALLEDEVLLGEYSTNYHKTHSVTLLPMLDELMRMLSLEISEAGIDAIAVAKGPGSFTGLRIGAATAKGLAFALGVPIIPVSTLEGLAYNLWGASGNICPLMDARRNQTYTAVYRFIADKAGHDEQMATVMAPCAVDIAEVIGRLSREGEPVTFLGDGVPVFRSMIEEQCMVPFRLAPATMNRQRAASVGAYAYRLAQADEEAMIAGEQFVPEYLRLSQAERERQELAAQEAAEQGKREPASQDGTESQKRAAQNGTEPQEKGAQA